MNVNGWTLKIHPAFGEKYKKLIIQVEELKEKNPEEYQQHPATKFLNNINEFIFILIISFFIRLFIEWNLIIQA